MSANNETATLKAVDSSRPRLVHSPSQQSIAASDDFYSMSDVTINSNGSRGTVRRYETPVSRNITPTRGNMENVNINPNPQNASRNQASRRSSRRPGSSASQIVRQSQPVTWNQNDAFQPDQTSPTPGLDDSPYVRFAIDQLTRDEEINGRGRQASVVSAEYPVERIAPDDDLGHREANVNTSPVSPMLPEQTETRPEPSGPELSVTGPPETLIALNPPNDTYRYPSLDFIPFPLRHYSLGLFIVACLLMIAGLAFCNTWAEQNNGLWDYDGFGGSRYFVVEFLPQLLGMIIVIWLFVIQAAIYRIAPLSMLSTTTMGNTALHRLPMLPKNFLLPDLSHFRDGDRLIGGCLVMIWTINWITVPLHSCLFQPRYYWIQEEGGFRWTPAQGVGWVLVVLYAILILAILAIMSRFSFGHSGLQWDPVCLADIVPIIQKSNMLHNFNESEISPSVQDHVSPRALRLGYWKTSAQPEIFYTIGEENAPTLRPSSQLVEVEKPPAAHVTPSNDVDVERQELHAKGSFERNLHSPFARYRWVPWFLRDFFVITWIVVALTLLVAFITVSFVNNKIQNGFVPLLSTLPSIAGFSPSNFLYSFIPALLGNFLFLAWQPIDVYFRAAQPYADLSSPHGASAEKSILLSYNSCLPFETTFLALTAGHYKVAFISFISLASLTLPVLAGGVFMALFHPKDNEIRISAYLPAYYTLLAFVILYALSFTIIWPRRKRYLPHSFYTYADTISYLYQSSLLADKVFREPRTKPDLVTRATVSPPGESDGPLYVFGVYYGQDGKEHLGIDRLRRSERGDSMDN